MPVTQGIQGGTTRRKPAVTVKPNVVAPQQLTSSQIRLAAGAPSVQAPTSGSPRAPLPQASPRRFGKTPPGSGDTDIVIPPILPPPVVGGRQTGDTDPTLLDDQTELDKLSAEFLESSLLAIEQQFGLTREQLLRDQSQIGQEYQLLTAQLEKQRGLSAEQAQLDAGERGGLQSGVAVQGQLDVESAFAEQQVALEQQRSGQLENIRAGIAGLDQQQALAELQARREAELRALSNEVLQALADVGV